VISQRDLADRLARRDPGAWSVVERVQDLAIADELRALHRRDHRTRLAITVHQDVPRGRGSARLDIDPFDGSAEDLVDHAISLALTAVGPAWSSTPPAAPAKVDVVDADLVKRELDAVALGTLAGLRRPSDLDITATAEVLREKITVIASSGFHTSWSATALRAHVRLATGNHSLALCRDARRADDLGLDLAVTDAAADLVHLAAAGPPPTGPCALWLGPEALLHRDPHRDDDLAAGGGAGAGLDHGIWAIFAHHADATVERQGLTRYRLRSEIAPGAAQIAEPLSITSDGALDFATRSAPVTDDAVAVRRFPLIDRGIAVGLGLSPREAALRHTDPNGGVRNLVIAPGSWPPGPSTTTRTIEVRRLYALSIDPDTGDASLDIALGLEHRPGRASPIPFTGGTVRLDLIGSLARARRSHQLLRRGAYHGPASVLIDRAELLP